MKPTAADSLSPQWTRGVAAALTAVLFALSLAGCAVDQKKEVALYRDLLNKNVPASQPYAPGSPLSLTQALALANANNEQLGLQGEAYVQSLINKNRAVSAFLPTVNMVPSYSLRRDSSAGGAIRNSKSDDRFQVPVVGAINVFRGFGDRANLRAAEAVIAQRRDLLLDLQQTVLLNVAQTYYQVLRSERQVGVLVNSLQLQEARAKDIQDRFDHGLATSLEVAQSRAQADATGATLVDARNDVANARTLLANLIALPKADGPFIDDYPVPDAPPDLAAAQAQALQDRLDLRSTRAAVAAARAAVDAAFAQYYPSVSLNVVGFVKPEAYASPDKWNAILVANIPIFSAGIIHADVRNAWSRWRQALLSESQTHRQVETDVEIAYENFTSNRQRIERLQSQVKAASDAVQLSKTAYELGLAINLDVLTSQDQLLTAELNLASATFDRTVFHLDLLRATGRLIVPPAPAPGAAMAPATEPATAPATKPSDS
ncbi:MAG: TolC family protein [Planctomycetota bacterium]|nr:TolC family protein [Planctomycetota bacterium]